MFSRLHDEGGAGLAGSGSRGLTPRTIWFLAAVSSFGAVACAEDPVAGGQGGTTDGSQQSAPTTGSGAGAVGSTSGTTGGSTSSTTGGSTSSTTSGATTGTTAAPTTGAAAGTTTGGVTEAGTAGDGGADAAPMGDASADAGTDAGLDSSTADAGGPVDYGAPGPYEVVIEKNMGEAFRNSDVNDDTFTCNLFIAAIGGDAPEETRKELTSYPEDMDRQLYTVFRPAQFEEGKKYPVLTWGNGTCSHPLLFDELLTHVASHGFVVVASNSRWVSPGTVMLHGLDFMVSENDNPESPFYGKLDTESLGAFGHSQGSMATVAAGADPRVVATVPIEGAEVGDAEQLHGPAFFIAGELDDIVPADGVEDAYNAATVPAVYGLSMGQDHLMPGVDPKYIWDAVVGWFKIHLEDDAQAREMFYGDDCGLCNDPRWQLQRKNL